MKPRNIFDYLTVFPPNLIRENEHQFNTPCPFCTEGTSVEHIGLQFYGTDRLVWFKNGGRERVYCRMCSMNGRGPHKNGIYYLSDLAALFGDDLNIDPNKPLIDLDFEPEEGSDEKLPDLIDARRRVVFHAHVDWDFWHQLGFEDDTIRHFSLGWGRLYTSWGRGHAIPMKVRTANREMLAGDYYEFRIPYTDETGRVRMEKKNSAGSKKNIFWHVGEGTPDEGVVITESPKNVLALWQMGYKNAIATFGAGVWTRLPDNFRFLQEAGYQRLYLVGDNDQAGRAFNQMLIDQAVKFGLECSVLEWAGAFGEGFDVADLLKERGSLRAAAYMQEKFVSYQPEPQQVSPDRAEYIPSYRVVDPDYTPRVLDPVPIEEVRGDGERSLNWAIRDFLEHYRERRVYGRGIALLLSVRPGAGKTYAMIQHAERVAQSSLVRKFKELDLLEKEIVRVKQELADADKTDVEAVLPLQDLLRKLEDRHENFSFQAVFWSAQYRDAITNLIATGADMRYYFDFQARSQENCENFEMATRLAMKGHNLMRFCEESCPFAARCKERGYLSQYEARKHYPIGVHRHEHLYVDSAKDGYDDLVVIDEVTAARGRCPDAGRAGRLYADQHQLGELHGERGAGRSHAPVCDRRSTCDSL